MNDSDFYESFVIICTIYNSLLENVIPSHPGLRYIYQFIVLGYAPRWKNGRVLRKFVRRENLYFPITIFACYEKC